MARGKLSFLYPEEIERIHTASVDILEHIGIGIRSEIVSEKLIEAGALRSENGKRVTIPEQMVKDALDSAPKKVLLAARGDEAKDIEIPSPQGELYVAPGGEGVYIKDLVNGTSRSSTADDLRDIAVICERLPQVDFFWALVGAVDQQPNSVKGLVELKTVLQYTNKHYQGGALSAYEASREVEMASILMGDEKELTKRPILSAVECPLSPLIFEEGLVEAQMVYAEAGIPVVSMSASMAGLTSPVTIAGTIAQINAENLASLVITQTVNKGAPWIYSSDSVPADLKRGSIDYGALEAQLMRTGAGEMGRYYRLPVMCAGIGIEETSLMLGNVREGVPYMINQALVPSDLGSGFGGINQAAGASFEQLLVDAWIWEVAKDIVREFETDSDAISVETVRAAVADGSFLTKRHTMSHFKKELSATVHPDAVLTGRGDGGERGSLIKKAHEAAQKMLAGPKPTVLPDDATKQLEEIVEKARRECG